MKFAKFVELKKKTRSSQNKEHRSYHCYVALQVTAFKQWEVGMLKNKNGILCLKRNMRFEARTISRLLFQYRRVHVRIVLHLESCAAINNRADHAKFSTLLASKFLLTFSAKEEGAQVKYVIFLRSMNVRRGGEGGGRSIVEWKLYFNR